MSHLRCLDLAGNRLHDLPAQMAMLTGLRHFRASSNRLRALPLTLVNHFDQLISFDISHNPLKVRRIVHAAALARAHTNAAGFAGQVLLRTWATRGALWSALHPENKIGDGSAVAQRRR